VSSVFTMSTTRSDDAHTVARTADRRGGSVQSVDRAVALLRAIAGAPHPATVWELANLAGINRSTAWRLLGTLERHGLVERDPITQRYAIGYTAVQLASGAGYDGLARRVRPILERVARSSGESVTLAAARRFSLVYVDQVDPPGVPWPDWLGRPLPLHATSSGKVFLAWLPEDEREAVLPAQLEAYTPRTITDRGALERALAQIRRVGYGTCVGELEEFSNGVSAAVVDDAMRPVVIVNIWGPAQRLTRDRLRMLGRLALKTVHEISLVLE
jgi:DNA-binding IclR family transcriptional regulator